MIGLAKHPPYLLYRAILESSDYCRIIRLFHLFLFYKISLGQTISTIYLVFMVIFLMTDFLQNFDVMPTFSWLSTLEWSSAQRENLGLDFRREECHWPRSIFEFIYYTIDETFFMGTKSLKAKERICFSLQLNALFRVTRMGHALSVIIFSAISLNCTIQAPLT